MAKQKEKQTDEKVNQENVEVQETENKTVCDEEKDSSCDKIKELEILFGSDCFGNV